MAPSNNSNHFITFLLLATFFFFFFQCSDASSNTINVVSFGARNDGISDSTMAFLRAWSYACRSVSETTLYVPQGNFLLKQVTFWGPCNNKITLRIDGTLVAPSDHWSLGSSGYWILFMKINGLSIYGGTLNAKGASYWDCKKAHQNCPPGARVSVPYIN